MMRFIITLILIFVFIDSSFAQKVEIIELDINSSSDDFAPCISTNSRKIYFTSTRDDNSQKIYIVERTSEGWDDPAELDGDINQDYHNGAASVTSDGQFMVFSALIEDKSYGRTDIYSAQKVNGFWTNIRNLGPTINSEAWDSQPSITSDGKEIYFTSDREGGFGAADIYYSKLVRGEWTIPINLGSNINTKYEEMAPVIGHDHRTFTFASDRENGLGGYDIYVSRKYGNEFGKAKNAKFPINSTSDDFFYCSFPNSDIALFASNRLGGTGRIDIFMAVPNPYKNDAVVLVEGTVLNSDERTPLGADIIVTDLQTGLKIADLHSDDITGYYNVVLQRGNLYSITATKDGYLFYSEQYAVPNNETGRVEKNDIILSPIQDGRTRLLVFFDFDKYDLKKESFPELERVSELLKENIEYNILLEGHTDDIGDDEYNTNLSIQRAKSVKMYLTNAGIDQFRIRTIGYGKRRPIAEDSSELSRAKNRRVEMIMINKND